jgi:hypothetical protein
MLSTVVVRVSLCDADDTVTDVVREQNVTVSDDADDRKY